MKTKHTQGPWHLEKYSGKHEYDFVWDVSNKIVCQLFSKSEDYFTNYKANAKLIAAAPELLDACITLIQQAEVCNYQTSDGLHQLLDNLAIKEIRKAIKKATE